MFCKEPFLQEPKKRQVQETTTKPIGSMGHGLLIYTFKIDEKWPHEQGEMAW